MGKVQDELDRRFRWCIFISSCGLAALIVLLFLLFTGEHKALARDLNGKYADSSLKPWFDKLASGKGLCCSMADGETIADVDWTVKDGHYQVYLDKHWIDVPEDAVITVPNLFGKTMVWPIRYYEGGISIRCFMPGSMT